MISSCLLYLVYQTMLLVITILQVISISNMDYFKSQLMSNLSVQSFLSQHVPDSAYTPFSPQSTHILLCYTHTHTPFSWLTPDLGFCFHLQIFRYPHKSLQTMLLSLFMFPNFSMLHLFLFFTFHSLYYISKPMTCQPSSIWSVQQAAQHLV